MDSIPKQRLEEVFSDFKQPYSSTEAQMEADRCLNCYKAPCISACPTEINIPQFIRRIAGGNSEGAAKTILDSNILGHSCAQACPTEVLCEGACVYHSLNKEPVHIGKLQRYAVEHAYSRNLHFYSPGQSTGKRVALIGAGPASLACAHELRVQGHDAVIFEKLPFAGGLNTFGIAPYKMKAPVSLQEVERISAMGVQFEFEKELGRNLDLKKLMEEFDVLFLGMGLGTDNPLFPGMNHPRLLGAVEFIRRMKTEPATDLRWIKDIKAALIVGAGNTALDAARELKGLGVPLVILSYRRGQAEMSGYFHEFELAKKEGVEFRFHTTPADLKADKPDHLTVTLEDHAGPRKFDLILTAIGQSGTSKILENASKTCPGIEFRDGHLMIDPLTGQTGNPRVFAGGDLANGGKEVVNAVAEGKRAAKAIHEWLYQERNS